MHARKQIVVLLPAHSMQKQAQSAACLPGGDRAHSCGTLGLYTSACCAPGTLWQNCSLMQKGWRLI